MENRPYDIADTIEHVAVRATIRQYANDQSGNDSLSCCRSTVEAKFGPFDEAEWDTACAILRERYGD